MNIKEQLKKYLHVIVLVVSLLLYLLAIFSPRIFSFVYPQIIYKICSQGFSHLFALIPFSFSELILFLLPVYVLYLLGKGLYLWVMSSEGTGKYWRYIGQCSLKWICYLISFFLLTAGVNYHRTPLVQYLGLEVEPVQKEELMQLCLYLVDKTNSAAMQSNRNREGRFIPKLTFSKNIMLINNSYDSLSIHYPACKGRYPSSKPLVSSYWVSYAHIMGFFFPFTFEVNINKDIPDFLIPAVIAHEQAHIRGFMREEEAEYAVYILARYTKNTELQYSFYISTLIRAMNALYSMDMALYRKLTDDFSVFLRIDLNSYYEYWRAFQSPISALSRTINDAYLKANSQSKGVQSYGRVVELLMADYKQEQTIKAYEYQ